MAGRRSQLRRRHYQLPPVRTGPKPTQRPWPPIWVGGNSPAALRRAVARGDGLHLIDLPAEEIAPIVAQLDQRLREAGRARTSFTVSLRKSVPLAADSRLNMHAVRRDCDAAARAGVDYLVLGPRAASSLDHLEASLEALASALLA